MTQEEKAKAYDEAYKIAKNVHTFSSNLAEIKRMEEIFPELKESEDEKIRKEIIIYLKSVISNKKFGDEIIESWIAWLEKQGEHKDYYTKQELIDMGFSFTLNGDIVTPDEMMKDMKKYLAWKEKQSEQNHANKVEPKFYEGQWIVWQDKYYKINYNGCGYELVDQNGLNTSLEYGTIDENAHLFTIEDAKDGDVLAVDDMIFIYKTILSSHVVSYCRLIDNVFNHFEYARTCCEGNPYIHPATKEQRDTLMKAIDDAGYTFDFEKKELKKIEQKPTWSKEDEKMCQETIDWFEKKCFPYALESENPARESIKWLKSLKPQNR